MGFGERLDGMRREAEDRRQAALADLDEVTAREFTGAAKDDVVRVTVDGHGAVRGVRVNPRRFDVMDGDVLGPQVVEAVRAARRASREGTSDVRERLSGGDADTLRRLGGSVEPGRRSTRPTATRRRSRAASTR